MSFLHTPDENTQGIIFSTIFVTVGTTRFDGLMEVMDKIEFQRMISDTFKCKRLIVQYGNSKMCPSIRWRNLTIETFRFDSNISKYISDSDLVISHCGAGSILEVTSAKKPLVAVINDTLMDNHQTELADAMVSTGPYIATINHPNQLIEGLPKVRFEDLKVFDGIRTGNFVSTFMKYL